MLPPSWSRIVLATHGHVRGMRVKRDIDEDGVWGCNGGWEGYQLGVLGVLGVLDVWKGDLLILFVQKS